MPAIAAADIGFLEGVGAAVGELVTDV
jgi:hypothetical protein